MTDRTSAPKDLVCVGAIAGAFGIRGEVRLKSFCANPEDIASYGLLFTKDGARRFEVTLTRAIPQGFAARLSGIATREQADEMKGTTLHADRARLPSLGDDEFYHADLIGLAVLDTGGVVIGRVSAVHNHGAGDILEVQRPGQKAAALLPFTREIVPTVDLASGRIIADVPEGLLE